MRVARSDLILGAPGSGKTARAEALAQAWLAQAAQHRAVYIATAQAWDVEMRERLERQRRAYLGEPFDRLRANGSSGDAPERLLTVEEPLELAHAIGPNARSDTLIIADCLTLWLTARLMVGTPGASPHPYPLPEGEGMNLLPLPHPDTLAGEEAMNPSSSLSPWERAGVRASPGPIAAALHACAGPMVLISNEVAGGDVFAGQDLREFLHSLGSLNQQAAAACERVTLMTAGGPLILKGSS